MIFVFYTPELQVRVKFRMVWVSQAAPPRAAPSAVWLITVVHPAGGGWATKTPMRSMNCKMYNHLATWPLGHLATRPLDHFLSSPRTGTDEAFIQMCVNAAGGQKLFMVAAFDDLPMIEHQNLIGLANR